MLLVVRDDGSRGIEARDGLLGELDREEGRLASVLTTCKRRSATEPCAESGDEPAVERSQFGLERVGGTREDEDICRSRIRFAEAAVGAAYEGLPPRIGDGEGRGP